MKNIFTFLTLAVAGTACQHQAPPTRAVAVAPISAKVIPKTSPLVPISAIMADTLTAPMRSLLQQYNLAALWRGQEPEARDSVEVLDGFFGFDHYRISFVFTRARQDSVDPAIFHVSGKSRYKQHITPFTS